jgi:hypothetical protein
MRVEVLRVLVQKSKCDGLLVRNVVERADGGTTPLRDHRHGCFFEAYLNKEFRCRVQKACQPTLGAFLLWRNADEI